jgi:hypothetical protein
MEQQTEERRPVIRSALHKACAQWTPVVQKAAVATEKAPLDSIALPGLPTSRDKLEVTESGI